MTNLIINLNYIEVNLIVLVLIFIAAALALYSLIEVNTPTTKHSLYGASILLLVISILPHYLIAKYSSTVLGEDYLVENENIVHYVTVPMSSEFQEKSVGMTAIVSRLKVEDDSIPMNCGQVPIKSCIDAYKIVLSADTNDEAYIKDLANQITEKNKEDSKNSPSTADQVENHLPNADPETPQTNSKENVPDLNEPQPMDSDSL